METILENLTAFDGRNKLIVADLEIDLNTSQVRRSGVIIALSVTQFRILLYLAAYPGTIISKTALNTVLDKTPSCLTSNAVDVHIARLRRRIDQDFFPNLIHTVRKKGYVLSERNQKKEMHSK
ncbi:MAG TPA: winged helix-turn-helix domain-containing protein [Advenella sp.]|nr:winged helix-turn-helix domain-containing protein [Advenella sp.]